MSCALKKRRSPPQQYMREGGSSPRSLALTFGMMRGSHAIPFTASAFAGILDSSRTTLEGRPFWTLRK
jgi:hypothetical protein